MLNQLENQIYNLATISPLTKLEILALLARVSQRVQNIPVKKVTPKS